MTAIERHVDAPRTRSQSMSGAEARPECSRNAIVSADSESAAASPSVLHQLLALAPVGENRGVLLDDVEAAEGLGPGPVP